MPRCAAYTKVRRSSEMIMPEPQPPQISLRPATQDDCRRLWDWRNESATREASFDTHFIPYEHHESWFSRKLQSQDTQIYIIMDASGHEVGYVRFNISGEEAEISVSVDKDERGKGYGAAAIRQGSDQVLSSGPVKRIIAHIKQDNSASLTAFQRAGYGPMDDKDTSNTDAYVMAYDGCP